GPAHHRDRGDPRVPRSGDGSGRPRRKCRRGSRARYGPAPTDGAEGALGPPESGEATRARPLEQGFQAGVQQRRLLLDAGQLPRTLEERLIQVQRRTHMHRYGSLMQIDQAAAPRRTCHASRHERRRKNVEVGDDGGNDSIRGRQPLAATSGAAGGKRAAHSSSATRAPFPTNEMAWYQPASSSSSRSWGSVQCLASAAHSSSDTRAVSCSSSTSRTSSASRSLQTEDPAFPLLVASSSAGENPARAP